MKHTKMFRYKNNLCAIDKTKKNFSLFSAEKEMNGKIATISNEDIQIVVETLPTEKIVDFFMTLSSAEHRDVYEMSDQFSFKRGKTLLSLITEIFKLEKKLSGKNGFVITNPKKDKDFFTNFIKIGNLKNLITSEVTLYCLLQEREKIDSDEVTYVYKKGKKFFKTLQVENKDIEILAECVYRTGKEREINDFTFTGVEKIMDELVFLFKRGNYAEKLNWYASNKAKEAEGTSSSKINEVFNRLFSALKTDMSKIKMNSNIVHQHFYYFQSIPFATLYLHIQKVS